MYDEKISENIINDLETKTIIVSNTAIVLASQGYLINKRKYLKLDWSSILIHCFENIDVFDDNQKHNIELLYNKLSTI